MAIEQHGKIRVLSMNRRDWYAIAPQSITGYSEALDGRSFIAIKSAAMPVLVEAKVADLDRAFSAAAVCWLPVAS